MPNADLAELQKEVQDLRARVTSLEKSSSWWYQFSSTALPIVITIFIAAFVTGSIYNSRFEGLEQRLVGLEQRVYNLEKDVRQIMVTQSAMQKSIEQMGKDIQEIKEILKEKRGEKLSGRKDSFHKRKTVSM